jgi:hypothetical protein
MPEELKAFIWKPEHGDPDDVSPAARVARALAAGCISCGASILGPAGRDARPVLLGQSSAPRSARSKCPVRPNQVTTIRLTPRDPN